jgi:hypothetical protein
MRPGCSNASGGGYQRFNRGALDGPVSGGAGVSLAQLRRTKKIKKTARGYEKVASEVPIVLNPSRVAFP